jgi:hypothetical protein
MAGCAAAFVPTQDPLTAWARLPLPADPRVAQAAMTNSACQGEQGRQLQIVLQDQRTASTAAFLTAGGGLTGSCLVTLTGGAGAGSLRSAPLDPIKDAIAVDERSTGGAGGASATLLGGRTKPGVARVVITLADGSTLDASVGSNHWLGWWPLSLEPKHVTAYDASGTVLQTLDDTTPGFEIK